MSSRIDSGRSHVLPSKRGRADARQYDGASACTVNSSVFAWLTRRWRMSTSGLMISVTPPRSLWVSNHGSAAAPGRCGAIAQAPASTMAVAPTSGTISRASGWRSLPSTVRAGRVTRRRSTARATKPVPITSKLHATRFSSTPSAAMNTKSTAPGTRASPRAWARKAKVSASQTTAPIVAPATNAHPELYCTGAVAVWNSLWMTWKSARTVSHVADSGKGPLNVSG